MAEERWILKMLKKLLENSGIVFGIHEDNIKKSLEDGTFDIPILAAEGKASYKRK